MQQRILWLGDQLLQKLIARQNRLLTAGIDLGKKRLKGQALDIFLPQRRQDVGDVAAEQVVGRDDDDVVGVELLGGAFIQQKGDPVQRHRGLAAAGYPLHKQGLILHVADDAVLLALDGLHNRAHLRGGVVRKGLAQHAVGDVDVRIKEIAELPVLNLKLPLERNLPLDDAGGRLELGRAGLVAVKEACNGGAPVVDIGLIAVLVLDGEQADVDLFRRRGFIAALGKVDAGKVRRFQ